MFEPMPRPGILTNTILLSLSMLLLLSGCIERYYPDEEEVQPGTLVISAHLTDKPGTQTIYLSRSTILAYPRFDPVSGCHAEVERGDGASVDFLEEKPGQYSGYLDSMFLKTGAAYRLHIIAPSGDRYESEYENLYPATGIEQVYYRREDLPTVNPEYTQKGIRFYIDFEMNKDSARYLRWQLLETYEMHNPDYIDTQVYDTDRRMKEIPDTSLWMTCWITQEVPEIYTLDLGVVEGSLYRQLPLHFVSGETQRLYYRYSLLVRQFSLSEEAFRYWDELGKNLQSKGNLFDTQPAITPSNICNVEDENERIIGYFSISGITEKRIMVEDVPDLPLVPDPNFCAPGGLPFSFARLSRAFLPYYMGSLNVNGSEAMGGIPKKCIDCREYEGSSHIRPDYW
jgi:hypothetical protein